MKKIVVAGAVIVNKNKEVLCALRSADMSMPGLWEFPGGKLEQGETAEVCLVREIQEELGCVIAVGRLVADIVHDYPAVQVRLITHMAIVTSGVPSPREHEKLVWLPAHHLNSLDWSPADLPTVDRLIRDFDDLAANLSALGKARN
ncbi:8-oxo-dGTP diphosphatase MutT [Paenibacillus sp. LHD-117]|uniref:8-oxo-dGTP diphosphatase MutT n=1 Tax=Paenibacillus sp. LHD-117 TaxID=3071412 RepID=UPI0027DFA7EC|nr:8-oxo-dGTP diphosphatase MutT [Paenibacillus sp. LHD-117]MDQ6420060.1 8-oxo-dGTP diphosphatase MutT [Paenibacillus sp. LHD-117]